MRSLYIYEQRTYLTVARGAGAQGHAPAPRNACAPADHKPKFKKNTRSDGESKYRPATRTPVSCEVRIHQPSAPLLSACAP